jgi:hypothetical protein
MPTCEPSPCLMTLINVPAMSAALTPQEQEVLRAPTEEIAVLTAMTRLEARTTRFCVMAAAVAVIVACWWV